MFFSQPHPAACRKEGQALPGQPTNTSGVDNQAAMEDLDRGWGRRQAAKHCRVSDDNSDDAADDVVNHLTDSLSV